MVLGLSYLLTLTDGDLEPPAGFLILMFCALIDGIALFIAIDALIRAILARKAHYKCLHCKNKFIAPIETAGKREVPFKKTAQMPKI
jgi:hypothetical protein